MPLSNFSGTVPIEYSRQIIAEATRSSAALSLGRRMPMGTKISQLPVPATFPTASFTNTAPGQTGRKAYTDLQLEQQAITAEEVAAVVAVPDQYISDNDINLWAWIRPQMSEAIARAVDAAVFFGTGAPATWPAGGMANNNNSTLVAGDLDPVDGVNQAMSAVEGRGLTVTGHSADVTVRGALRGVRDENGSLLLGPGDVESGGRGTLYGAPINYSSYSTVAAVDFFTGAFEYLIMGIREDIRFVIDPSATIADAAGVVLVSGFQDNVTPCKVFARFGCTIVRPATPRAPAGPKIPFARAKLVGMGAPLAEGRSSAKK